MARAIKEDSGGRQLHTRGLFLSVTLASR